MRTYLAVGSNVGDTFSYIDYALRELKVLLKYFECSDLYKTKPYGVVEQANFLNCAVFGDTDLQPLALLKYIKNLETQIGRIQREKWGPRELDIDIIFCDDRKVSLPDLTIPHSQYKLRDFVLRPLLDINPNLRDPESNESLKEILNNIPKDQLTIIGKVPLEDLHK